MERGKALKQLQALKRLTGKEMRLAAESWNKPWQTLISIIMSARTRDEVTILVAQKLFKTYNSPEKIAKAGVKKIAKIIRPVNFYRNKSKSIVGCAKILSEQYNSKPPRDFEKLIELPGVGRKTANVFLSEFGGDNIGIDTHVSYISQRLGWTTHQKQKDIEQDLESLFPRKLWKDVNPILVRFGKNHLSRKKKNELLDKIRSIN